MNEFGRRELIYKATLNEHLHWEKDFMFHCDVCGAKFSFKEAILQQKKDVDPQTKLDSLTASDE